MGQAVKEGRGRGLGVLFMPNHVHLILTPNRTDGLGLTVGEAHGRYTNFINARGRWTGHLFQSRFASVAMDELHLLTAASYVSLNPVRAGLVGHAADWVWSSVRAHLAGTDDGLVIVRPVLDRVSCFADLLLEDREEAFAALRRSEGTGRPLVPRSSLMGWSAQSAGPSLGVPQDQDLQPAPALSS